MKMEGSGDNGNVRTGNAGNGQGVRQQIGNDSSNSSEIPLVDSPTASAETPAACTRHAWF
jgi:hypothetical protein